MEILPVWKRVYPVIACKNPNVTNDIVEDALAICREHISDVLLEYEAYTKESFLQWKQQPGLQEIVSDDDMCNFIHNLSKRLDLNSNVAWVVICNFLMYEYYGKVDELKILIKFDSKIEYFMEYIWYFYSADRMFLLKTLRHLLETVEDDKNVYYDKIQSFMKNVDMSTLWKNLVKVFNNLIHEIRRDTVPFVTKELLVEWIHRNNREQLEVLLLLIQTLKSIKLTGSELEELLKLFIRHAFTRLPCYEESRNISRHEDLCQVKNLEIALVLAIMDRYWKSGIGEKLPPDVEKNLELLQLQGDNSVVMFAWSVFKTSCGDRLDTDMESCKTMVDQMLKKKVFLSLYQLLTHRIFLDHKAGTVLVESVYTLMVEFSKVCADFAYLHEQDGVAKIVAELSKRKGLVVFENLEPIFQLSMAAFPFVFEPFLEMCKTLICIPGNYDNIIKLLKSIPTFLAEIMWTHNQDEYVTDEVLQLFIDSRLFMIPVNTRVEKFVYQGMNFSKFHYPFSFFLLMEQFTKSWNTISFKIGPTWRCYKNLTELVHVGFKFIHYILKLYEGDYRKDTELRTLVQRLDIVPAQFCEGKVKNFDFIKLYFSVNCTLIMRELLDYMEAFPPVQRKKFMPPVVTSCSRATRYDLFRQLHDKCQLYVALTEEEQTRTHALLIQYLELIYFMVKKNLYHYEVQIAGMWHIIYTTFPLHRQWNYDDPFEEVTITKLCISIFVEIFKRHLFKINGDSVVIFEMVMDAFYYEDITLPSYMSIFPKDKFYLQNVMEEESNWNNGPALKKLECLRLQVVLLLLLYKHKAKMGGKKNILDDDVGFFAKAVTPYIINPYSLALRKLSCRFLEVLSRDRNIPLMALLGLDYDQVQRLYLDRLRDSIEDDDLKVFILDFIGTSVLYQHGMTAAFFNVKRPRKWYIDNKENTIEPDTVSDFMVDYLQNIRRSPEFLKNPLQIGMLHIMTNLWISRKTHLIDEVINLAQFWPLLGNPLHREFDQFPKVYAYIFQIYGIQLLEVNNDPKFLTSVDKFVGNTKQVKNWMEYMWATFKEITPTVEDIEDRQLLLKSWMEFIIVLEKTKELKKFDEVNKFEFIVMTLDGLTLPTVNTYCLKLWMDLILLQLSYWGIPSTTDFKILAEKAIATLSITKSYYNDLDQPARLAVLAVVQQLLEILHAQFESCPRDLMDFLGQFGPMLDYEYAIVQEQGWKMKEDVFDVTVREHLLPWMMCVRIVSGLFEFKNVEDISSWFTYRNLIERFMDSTCYLIQHEPTLPLAKIILHSLGLYASSPLCFDFLNVKMNNFFLKLEGPIMSLLFGKNGKINALHLEEGWIICSLFIKFQTAYFKTLQYMTLPSIYHFVILSENILIHIFNILDTTVALKALDVVINMLVFFDSVLEKWRLEWYRKSNATYNFVLLNFLLPRQKKIKRMPACYINALVTELADITRYGFEDRSLQSQRRDPLTIVVGQSNLLQNGVTRGVNKVVNSCLYAILRPKNIIVYVLDESNRFIQINNYPAELLVAIVNRLVTAVGLGFSIFYRVNPSLIDLLDTSLPDTMVTIIENDFSVPKFELPISNELTYGMLLCLAHFLCKTLDALKLDNKRVIILYSTEERSSTVVPPEYFTRCYGMVQHQGLSDDIPTQNLSEFLSYGMYEYSGLADPWILKLDYNRVQQSLESLMLFLAQQIFIALHTAPIESAWHFKCTLSSELQFFYEHVTKITSSLLRSGSTPELSLLTRAETDILKRYLFHHKEIHRFNEVADNNFCIVISYWFINICKLN